MSAHRYLKLFKNRIFYLVLLVGLVVVSSITHGKASNVFSVLAGIAMIYAAVVFILWLIKTPVKKQTDEGS